MPRLKKIDIPAQPKKVVQLKDEYKLKPIDKKPKKKEKKMEKDRLEKEQNRLERIKLNIEEDNAEEDNAEDTKEAKEDNAEDVKQDEEDTKEAKEYNAEDTKDDIQDIKIIKINNEASDEKGKELNKIYLDDKGRQYVYKMTKGKHLKADGTYEPYMYKRKYYPKFKRPGPELAIERRKLRAIIKKLTNLECTTIIKFINDNIIKNDKQADGGDNKTKSINV
jgi:hypothetical protein